MTDPLRVLVVEGHPVFRRGLRAVLTAEPAAISLVAEAATVAAGRAALHRLAVDVLVVGEDLPDGSGTDLARAVRADGSAARTVLLARARDVRAVFGAFDAGAAGYLLRSVEENALLDAIRTVAAGGQVLDAALTAAMVNWLAGRREAASAPATGRSLTERQQRILSLIGQGLSNRQIGQSLGIAEKTVKNHVTEVLRRLGLTSRTEAALFFSRAATGI